jgi:hypothetical protein
MLVPEVCTRIDLGAAKHITRSNPCAMLACSTKTSEEKSKFSILCHVSRYRRLEPFQTAEPATADTTASCTSLRGHWRNPPGLRGGRYEGP